MAPGYGKENQSMKKEQFLWLAGISRLIRLGNLMMVLFTMILTRYALILPIAYSGDLEMLAPFFDFALLVIATLLITAGGYIINDYFDVRIDRINRPEKMTIYRFVTPQRAIKVHMILNGLAIAIGFYLARNIQSVSFGFIFPFVSGLLWFYSAKYKRIFFLGNLIVAFLSSFVIMLVWLFEYFHLRLLPGFFSETVPRMNIVTWIILAYALFAFLVTIIREIIKDMEDVEGDRKFDCRTIPIVLGIGTGRYILVAVALSTMFILAYGQLILWRMGMTIAVIYFLLAVQIPTIYMIISILRAAKQEHFRFISLICKLIMVAGILSMFIFNL